MTSYDYRKTYDGKHGNEYTVHSGLFENDVLNGYGMVLYAYDYDIVTDVTGIRHNIHCGVYREGELEGFYLHIVRDEEPYGHVATTVTCGIGRPGAWELAVVEGEEVIGIHADCRCLPLPGGSELRIEEEDGQIVFCGMYRDGVRDGLGCAWDTEKKSAEGYWKRGDYLYKRLRTDGYWEKGKLVKIREEDRLVDVHE